MRFAREYFPNCRLAGLNPYFHHPFGRKVSKPLPVTVQMLLTISSRQGSESCAFLSKMLSLGSLPR
jgi:hypothetical protein